MNNETRQDTPLFYIMEAKVITKFIAKLVTTVRDCVQCVSDECLARGLISESTYRTVTESGGTSEDKARTLIRAVMSATEIEGTCLHTLLEILDDQLPSIIKGKLVSEIKKELEETANPCREVVPATSKLLFVNPKELSKESFLEHNILLRRFESAVTQHAEAKTEKKLLEERLKARTEKCDTLKRELESIRSKNEETQGTTDIQRRITAITTQIENFKDRIQQLEKKVEEQAMYMKRGQNTINTKTRKCYFQVVQHCQQEITRKEEEHSQALRDTEASAFKRAEDDMRVRDKKHQLELKEKELRIKELEVEAKHQRNSSVLPADILKPENLEKLYMNTVRGCLTNVVSKWRDIGTHLGFSANEMDNIHQQNSDNEQLCIKELLRQWLDWYPGDVRGSTSYPTYSRIQSVLVDSGLGNVVRDFAAYQTITNISKPSDDDEYRSDSDMYDDYDDEYNFNYNGYDEY